MPYTLYRSPHPHPQPDTEGQRIGTYPDLLQALDMAAMADRSGWHWITPGDQTGYYRDAVELIPPPRPILTGPYAADLQILLGQ